MLRKIAIGISAVLALMLFSACGTEGVKTSDEAPALSAEPGGMASAEAEEPSVGTAAPSSGGGSTYLTDAKFDTEEALPDYDANNDFFNHRILRLAETDDAYYFYDDHERIMLYDKASGITMPLCGKPECSHDSASCNAYVGLCMGISLYDGRLYAFKQSSFDQISVSSISLDGSERREVKTIMCTDWSGNFVVDLEAGIHRGELYCAGEVQTVRDGETYERMLVKAYALDEDRDVTIFDEYYKGNGVFDYRLNFAGTHLYITVRTQNRENDFTPGVTAYDWDIKTHTLTTVASVAEEDIGHINGFYTSTEGETYLLCNNGNEDPAQRHYYIYGYDAETREFVRCAESENSMNYIENGIILGAIYNNDGEREPGQARIMDMEGNILYAGVVASEDWLDGITLESFPYFCGGNENAVVVAQSYKSEDGAVRYMWACVDLGGEEPPKLLFAE